MKYLIASDLHGSAFFCRKLMQQIEKEAPSQIILLGDILYHGPRNDLPEGYAPKEVIAMLNPLKDAIICVRGNCDAEVDQMVLAFDITPEYRVHTMNGHSFFLTHGHHDNSTTPPSATKLQSASYVLLGHTHIPCKEQKNGIWYCNPGSVSIPKAGSMHSYLLLEQDTLLWKNLDGETYDTLVLA